VSSSVLRPVALGLVAGFVSGLFGVGGGVIIVPGLTLWLGFSIHRASATSVAAMIVSASSAVLMFGVEGAVDWHAAAFIVIGTTVGAAIGARAMGRIPESLLTRVFAVVMVVAAVRLVLE